MKNDIVTQAVRDMVSGQFKLTAIKVELEAQLDRRSSGGCDDCEDGRQECGECNGDWEGGRCEDRCDEGYFNCEECEDGVINPGTEEAEDCDSCDGNGYIRCEECSDDGYYANCEYCDEGYQDCYECGNGGGSGSNWGNDTYCQNWILEKLEPLGLSERHASEGQGEYFTPKHPLVFAKFYNDGSVDSELTFTLSVDDPENVLLLPKFIDVFNEFATEVNGQFDTRGAGMHMALINTEDGSYPSRPSTADRNRFYNFQKSMTLLLPALFFLGTSSDTSRGLRYRRPFVSDSDKYSAISFRSGALEFRVFDTCYDKPDTILDNIVVMGKAMKFWTRKYRKHGLGKKVKSCRFGVDTNNKLERFYVTSDHLDLLNGGLRILKPSYYTVGEVKKQRQFKTTKRTTVNYKKKVESEATVEYREYTNRYDWNAEIRRHRYISEQLDIETHRMTAEERLSTPMEQILERVKPTVEQQISEFLKSRKELTDCIKDKVNEYERVSVGEFTLEER